MTILPSVRLPIALLAVLFSLASCGDEPTVFIVRHAEKAQGGDAKDPELSDAGRARASTIAQVLKNAGITAIYATELKRTQQTAAPLAQLTKVDVTIVPAKETATLASRVKAHDGRVLIVGHSNTIPEILQALGVSDYFRVPDDEYDNLFVLPTGGATRPIRLRLPVGP